MANGRTYEEYLQSDWYKDHMEKKKTTKNSKVITLEVKDKLYKKVKRNKVLTYLKFKSA
jgi:hypothetical protein